MPIVAPHPRERRGTVTEREYQSLPEGAPFELWDGVLVHRVTGQEFLSVDSLLALDPDALMSPAPSFFHQRTVGNVLDALRRYVRPRKLGTVLTAPLDVRLPAGRTVQPDVLFVAAAGAAVVGPQGVDGPPDLVVEVLSPGTAYKDLREKRTAYAEAGVREYWIVDPIEESVEVHVLGAEGYALAGRYEGSAEARSDVLDGLAVPASTLFED